MTPQMTRKCAICNKVFRVPFGHEHENNCCPYCGFMENTETDKPSCLPPGFVLHGKYVVGMVIGNGDDAIIYRGWDNRTERVIVIKEFFPMQYAHREYDFSVSSVGGSRNGKFEVVRKKFSDEIKKLERFKRIKNTVGLYDYFDENKTQYVITEYMDGMNMQQLLSKNGRPFLWKQIAPVIKNVGMTIIGIHEAGLVHRDICPENIIISNDQAVRIAGCDKAEHINEAYSNENLLCRPGFSAPELYNSSGRPGTFTDVYSLAATIYYLLTGKTIPEPSVRLRVREYVKMTNFGFGKGFSASIDQALAIDPRERTEKVRDLIQDLNL